MLRTRPPSRTFIVSASAATKVYGPGVQRAGPEVLDVLVELLGHHGHLRARQPGDAQGLHQPVHPTGRDTEQVAGRDHRGQRRLGAAAPLEQPLREVRPLTELGDRDVQSADTGVQVAVPVAVAAVGPLLVPGAVGGAADASASAESNAFTNMLAAPASGPGGLGQVLGQDLGRVDTGSSGHRVSFFEWVVRDYSKDPANGLPTETTDLPRSSDAARP